MNEKFLKENYKIKQKSLLSSTLETAHFRSNQIVTSLYQNIVIEATKTCA